MSDEAKVKVQLNRLFATEQDMRDFVSKLEGHEIARSWTVQAHCCEVWVPLKPAKQTKKVKS